jgi:hypothetical protein
LATVARCNAVWALSDQDRRSGMLSTVAVQLWLPSAHTRFNTVDAQFWTKAVGWEPSGPKCQRCSLYLFGRLQVHVTCNDDPQYRNVNASYQSHVHSRVLHSNDSRCKLQPEAANMGSGMLLNPSPPQCMLAAREWANPLSCCNWRCLQPRVFWGIAI